MLRRFPSLFRCLGMHMPLAFANRSLLMPRHAVGPAIRETRPAQCRGYGSSPHRSHRRWIRSWAASEEGDEGAKPARPDPDAQCAEADHQRSIEDAPAPVTCQGSPVYRPRKPMSRMISPWTTPRIAEYSPIRIQKTLADRRMGLRVTILLAYSRFHLP